MAEAHPDAALFAAVSGVVFQARQAARALGRETVFRRFPVTEEVNVGTRLVDAERARQIAKSHVELIRAEFAKAADDPISMRVALENTEYRARAIAATEAASAASAERLDAALEFSERTGIALFKEWNAEGDSCPLCAEVDGETVPIDASFSNGSEPGQAHPSCRCWPEIFTASGVNL